MPYEENWNGQYLHIPSYPELVKLCLKHLTGAVIFCLLQSEKALVYTIIKPYKSNVEKEKQNLLTAGFPESNH